MDRSPSTTHRFLEAARAALVLPAAALLVCVAMSVAAADTQTSAAPENKPHGAASPSPALAPGDPSSATPWDVLGPRGRFATIPHDPALQKVLLQSGIGQLAVQFDGIQETLASYSPILLHDLTGRDSIHGQDPVFTVLSMVYQPERWLTAEIFPVDSPALGRLLGFSPTKRWMSVTDYYHSPNREALNQQVKDFDQLQARLKARQETRNTVVQAQAVGLDDSRLASWVPEGMPLTEFLRLVHEPKALSAWSRDLEVLKKQADHDKQIYLSSSRLLNRIQTLVNLSASFLLVPNPNSFKDEWTTPWNTTSLDPSLASAARDLDAALEIAFQQPPKSAGTSEKPAGTGAMQLAGLSGAGSELKGTSPIEVAALGMDGIGLNGLGAGKAGGTFSDQSDESDPSDRSDTTGHAGMERAIALGGIAEAGIAGLVPALSRFRRSVEALPSYPSAFRRWARTFYTEAHPFRKVAWIYLLSALAWGVGSLTGSGIARRAGIGLLAAGFLAHTGSEILRLYLSGHMPVSTMYESITFATWGMMGVGLTMSWFTRRAAYAAAAGGMGFLALTLVGFMPLHETRVHALRAVLNSYWLNIHVTMMLMSYGTFLLAGVLSAAYLAGPLLKRIGALGSGMGRIGPIGPIRQSAGAGAMDLSGAASATETKEAAGLSGAGPATGPVGGAGISAAAASGFEALELYAYRCVQVGWPLLTVGVFLGGVWAQTAWGRFWGWDPKETWALITWIVYTVYLHTRMVLGWRGRISALACVIGLAAVLLTWLGVSYLPGLAGGLHSYASPTG